MPKKRIAVCNFLRNMLHNVSRGSLSSLVSNPKKKLSRRICFVVSPGKGRAEPRSEASTPRRGDNAFPARKQSHGNLNNQRRLEAKKEPIVIKRTPSLALMKRHRGDSQSKKGSSIATGSTSEYSTSSGSFVRVNETALHEREKLIQFNKFRTFLLNVDYEKYKEIPETTMEYYKFVKSIGKGAFGSVTLGLHKLTGRYVAIKAIEKENLKDEFSKRKVLREIYILKKMRHTNIIRLLEVFESAKQVQIVMEYAGGGDLLHYVKRKRHLSEEEARPIFRQIVFGLAHINSRNVLHRDIKLDNILLDSDGCVKICDFGVSKIIDKNKLINDQCGTPAYIAPEIISNLGYKGFYADLWSLGVLLYAMLCGTVPFKASSMEELHELIREGHFTYPVEVSDEARKLVGGLLKIAPRERLSVPEILRHPWLNPEEGKDELDEEDYYKPKLEDAKEQPTINTLCVENLFFPSKPHVKLLYKDYCHIANDFYTHHIDEETVRVVETYGYPKEKIMQALTQGQINHATASYNLLELA
eukprot:TRINITY_DN14831_c0_g4_i1.p1 TRINITY_DN14831_c0_g4~~TRINITY_DN14831_c0_g4_i1.p1  ORF type:complete len:529 (-),score=148.59 TRINITY_DN14831_c0_g4_i1:111-1697(-)